MIYGSNGWIGSLLVQLLKDQGASFEVGTARLEDRAAIMADIERVKPTRILNAAGVTGRPNVDWCETNKQACVRGNVIGTLNLADVCDQTGIHMVYYGTGCIFHYDEDFPEGSGKVCLQVPTTGAIGKHIANACDANAHRALKKTISQTSPAPTTPTARPSQKISCRPSTTCSRFVCACQ